MNLSGPDNQTSICSNMAFSGTVLSFGYKKDPI